MQDENGDSAVYGCNLQPNDSLRVSNGFDFNPLRSNSDIEFVVAKRNGMTKYPIYLSVESVQALVAQLTDALHTHFEGPIK